MTFRRVGTTYIVRLERGEEIIEGLAAVARKYGVSAGKVSGIGAVEKIELGYFDEDTKEYNKHEFSGGFELLNVNGNISLVEGYPTPHLHVLIGDSDYNVRGGHLVAGTISVTGEFIIQAFDTTLAREKDPDTGLNLLDLD